MTGTRDGPGDTGDGPEAPAPALPDRVRPGLAVLVVGINPGLRSARLGHHFAGRGNRFWKLLHRSGLTPRLLGYEDDRRLPEHGIGLTNIAARPTRSSGDLETRDFELGGRHLARKVRKLRPRCVAFAGVTAYRELLRARGEGGTTRIRCGLQKERFEGAPVFVLPNPSGRNAHYSLERMVEEYRRLARWLAKTAPEG